VQLIFTIGKGRINEKYMPPKFIGAFDAEKIAFIPYNAIMEVFSQTDFNWNVAPSDHSTKEFQQLKTLIRNALELSSKEDGQEAYKFDFVENRKELKTYISKNFKADPHTNRGMRITQNNFVAVYNQWRKEVMPSIAIDFNEAKKNGLLDSAFYLADLMSGRDNFTLMDKLKVLLRKNKYILVSGKNNVGLFNFSEVTFRDNMQAHKTFWARYQRPPKQEYWDKIVERNDLLVPQDIRERKGSYFTPSKWVVKSQEYIADFLQDEDWQEKYYIWDCCAGTGNLLANLTNKYNIWASTDRSEDVHIMHERIASMGKGSNLLDSHVFQFDFLDGDFADLPEGLKEIINDEEKRKKLIIYINPPYKEASNATTVTGNGENQTNVAKNNKTYEKYLSVLGKAARELYIQFFARIYKEMRGVILGEFSTLKALQASNYDTFRNLFTAKLEALFLVPSYTFDNVDGKFPIGFHIWDTSKEERFKEFIAEVYDEDGDFLFHKRIFVEEGRTINTWLKQFEDRGNIEIASMSCIGTDFQHSKFTNINQSNALKGVGNAKGIAKFLITQNNLIPAVVYFNARLLIDADWKNNRDQFLYPRKAWIDDMEFQYDCLAYTLFHGKNNVSSANGVNHWIPFTEQELQAPDKFQSHFMSDFIAGKTKNKEEQLELEYAKTDSFIPLEPIQFSPEAQAVMDAGRELWYYYMHHKDNELYGKESINVNASYYDIRRYFQGIDEKGKMNNKSKDEKYMLLWDNIKKALDVLAKKIEPKVYLYGFLLDETTLPEDEPTEEPVQVAKPAKMDKPKAPRKSDKTVVHYHINANNVNLQTDGTINIGEINEK
jgi:hypothetical protein